MFDVTKFQMAHLDNFNCRDIIGDIKLTMLENKMNPQVDCVSILKGEEVVALCGLNHLRLGVGECWILGGHLIYTHKKTFFRVVKSLVEFCLEKFGLHRLQIAVDCEWKLGHKWATMLGFEFEGIQRKYDYRGADHAIYTRFT